MNGVWGKKIGLSIFGESHGNGIGIVISGIEAGLKIDLEEIQKELNRRAPGRNSMSTERQEKDEPEILSGIFNGYTTGAPVAVVIRNSDFRAKDYSKIKDLMRPGHGDYPGYIKYGGFNDYRGGGHFSGRITAPLVFAGALAKQILNKKGIIIGSHIKQIGKYIDNGFDMLNLNEEILKELYQKELPILDNTLESNIRNEILKTKEEGDSIGGVIECGIIGIKAGVGNPFFDSLESIIAHLAFSVPAVKGIEFGMGFGFKEVKGSEAKDEYYVEDKEIKTFSNNNGGITGGITNGMPVVFRVVIKPTPSIRKEQRTVNVRTLENTTIKVEGRHDPCIVQRALVVIEAIAAIGVLELLNY